MQPLSSDGLPHTMHRQGAAAAHGGLRLLLIICLLAGAVACTADVTPTPAAPGGVGSPCPVPQPRIMPEPWLAEPNGTYINADQDEDLECLVIYRYNVADGRGPLGGIVFDPQPTPGVPGNLISYRLLPRINTGYTQGTGISGAWPGPLGSLGQSTAKARLYDANNDGRAEELGIVGANAQGDITTLSIFRWAGQAEGYRLLGYFHAESSVEIASAITPRTEPLGYNGLIERVVTNEPLHDRSGLRRRFEYRRQGSELSSTFYQRTNWLDFEFGKPASTCYFPEGEVLRQYFYDVAPIRPVYDLAVRSEDAASGRATVCVGYWESTAETAARRIANVDMEREQQTSPARCEAWAVRAANVDPTRTSCSP